MSEKHCMAQVIKAAAVLVPELAGAETEQVTAGLMPYPVDAHPIVGFTKEWPNLYVAVMHSGATLAPLMGRLVSEEIVSKQEADMLAPYRFSVTSPILAILTNEECWDPCCFSGCAVCSFM